MKISLAVATPMKIVERDFVFLKLQSIRDLGNPPEPPEVKGEAVKVEFLIKTTYH